MLRITEVTSKEHLEELRLKENPVHDYLYICKYAGKIMISDNGTLKDLSGSITVDSVLNETSENPISCAAVAKVIEDLKSDIKDGTIKAPTEEYTATDITDAINALW